MGTVLLLILGFAIAIPALVWATGLESFSMTRMLAFFLPFMLGVPYLLVKRRPTWILFSILLGAFPILGIIMPPVRLQLSVFHAVALILLLLCLRASRDECPKTFFSRDLVYFWGPLLLLLPSILLAINVQHSGIEWLEMWGYYAVVIVGLGYFSDVRRVNNAHALLSVSLAVISISVLLHKLVGVRFDWLYAERSLVSAGSTLVKQGSGLFQDPQKAAQVIAMLTAYLTVVWKRKAVPKGAVRLMVGVSILLAIPALFLTLSRIAIAAGVFFSVVGLFLLSRQAPPTWTIVRVAVIGVLVIVGLTLGAGGLVSLLPSELQGRFSTVDVSAIGRWQIWTDTFNIFLSHPLFGIGPGNYKEYFIQANSVATDLRTGLPTGYVPDQPESGYLKILYEVGAIGTLAVLWFVWAAGRQIASNLRSPMPDVRSRAWGVVVAMGVFLVTFVTLFTVSDARSAILPIFFLTMMQADRARYARRAVGPDFSNQVVMLSREGFRGPAD